MGAAWQSALVALVSTVAALVVLSLAAASLDGAEAISVDSNTLASLPIRGNEPTIAYFWNAVQILTETDVEIRDVASSRLFVKHNNATYARSVMLHGGDSRWERNLTRDTWLFKRVRPMTWQHCESGPHAIGGTLHQVLHFREGSSTAVALVRNPSTHADPTLSIWIYHNCAWEEVSSHHDDRPAGTYFPAAFQYEPLEVVVLFGSFTTLLCSFSTCFCFETRSSS